MNKRKTLIVPDIHNKIDIVDEAIEAFKNSVDEIVFLGDIFDDFGDTLQDAEASAIWLKYRLHLPNCIFIAGNHDLPYMFPKNDYLRCSGNTRDKSEVINNILNKNDWNQFKLAYETQGYWISHAGITKHHFECPIEGISSDRIYKLCDKALKDAESGVYNSILGAGYSRGGPERIGGITWCDWRSDFTPVHGLKQIVGHTKDKTFRTAYVPNKKNKEGEAYCIDCDLKYFGLIDNGEFKIVEKTDKGFKTL